MFNLKTIGRSVDCAREEFEYIDERENGGIADSALSGPFWRRVDKGWVNYAACVIGIVLDGLLGRISQYRWAFSLVTRSR